MPEAGTTKVAGAACQRLRRSAGWLVAGAMGVMSCAPVFAQERELNAAAAAPGHLVPGVEALPGSLDLVISVQDLTTMRARAGGQALLAFLGEVGEWERSTSALTDLGLALDLPADRAIDELVGRACVLGVRGAWGSGTPGVRAQTMLITGVSEQTERRVRERLKPAPRGLESGLPILALEGGGVELATAPGADHQGRLLISPRGSTALFDEMLGVLASGSAPKGERLMDRAWWGQAAGLSGQPLVVMIRDAAAAKLGGASAPDPERYFVLGGRVGDGGFAGRFVASDSMLLASKAQAEPGLPGAVLASLEKDAILLMAGSLHAAASGGGGGGGGGEGGDADANATASDAGASAPVSAIMGAGMLGSGSGGSLLSSVLSMMHAPASVEERFLGPMVLAVHEPKGSGGVAGGLAGGLAGTLVARVDRTRETATAVHRWLSGFAEQGHALGLQEKLDRAPLGLARVLMISAGEDGPMEGYLRRGGSVAWCFVPDAASPSADAAGDGAADADGPGWWVVSVRTVARQEAACRDQVEEISRLLARDKAVAGLYYRLSLRPAKLAAIAAANREPGSNSTPDAAIAPAAGADRDARDAEAGARGAARALRWLDEVSTSVQRSGPGVVMGGVKVMMETKLLRE